MKLFRKIVNSMLISYRKVPVLTDEQGYKDCSVVANRYFATMNNIRLGEFVSIPQVKDLLHFINSNSRRVLDGSRRKKILDVGCGSGAYSLLFLGEEAPLKEFIYAGCDVDDAVIGAAQKAFPDANFFLARMEDMPEVQDNAYDVVLCSGALQYVLGGWKNALSEMIRVSRKHILIARLPSSKFHDTFYVRQTVMSRFGYEVRNFAVINREEFEQECESMGVRICDRDCTAEIYRIPAVSEKIVSYQFLLEKPG